jgi:hypothetical protein
MVGRENIVIFRQPQHSQKVLDVYKKYQIEPIPIDSRTASISIQDSKNFTEVFLVATISQFFDTDEFLCTYKDGKFRADDDL